MTNSDWNKALRGDPDREVIVNGEHTKVRYLVVDAMSAYAKTLTKDGRPDKAGVLRYIADRIRSGNVPTKEKLSKAAKELEIVRAMIVDGQKLVDG